MPLCPAGSRRRVWIAFCAIMLGACLGMALGSGQAADPTQGVLDLPGGGVLPGAFVPVAATDAAGRDTLLWKSPLFTQPFEFCLDEIVGVRLAGPPMKTAAAFRVHLRDGDMLDGSLEAIDASHVTVLPVGAGDREAVRVRRSIIDGISRLGGTIAGSYVGPGGLTGWEHAPANAWRAEAGRIVASRPATASLDVGAPARACYDVLLSWRRNPEFRIAVAAAEKPAADAFWVELLQLPEGEAAVVVRQEAARAAVEPLAFADGEAKTARIVIFVDQEQGRLVAFTVNEGKAGPVADITVPPPASRAASGRFRITVGSGDVCLESLRVGPWTTPEPRIDQRSVNAVVARDGRVTDADIESFDKASGELVLVSPAGNVRMKLDDINDIRLVNPGRGAAEEGGRPPVSATVRVARASGGSLAGRLVAVGEHALRLQVAGIDDDVAVPLGDIASLTSLEVAESPRELPGRSGSLLADGVMLRGCVVDGSPWSAGMAWQPQGSATASPLAMPEGGGPKATIEYVPRPSRDVAGDAEVEIGGIGGMVNQDAQGFFVVTMLSEDGAAAQDGRLMPGERLLAIKPRAEGGFVPTKGLDVTTVMNLLRGRVGSPVVLRVAVAGNEPREIDLKRGLIYVAGRDVLEQALAAHARLATPAVARPEEAGTYPSAVILRSGDVVPCEVVSIDAKAMRLRTPIADGGTGEPVAVATRLVQAVELDPSVPARTLEKPRFDRLLTLPRSQREAPPTHMIRLLDGDYLRGRLESLDGETLVVDVRGEAKKLARSAVARIIWLNPDDAGAANEADGSDAGAPAAGSAGLLVQGVAAGRRITLVAESVADSVIRGANPALGPGRIDLKTVDRLLVGRAIEDEADELPYHQWRLRPAPEPRALRGVQP